MTSLNPCVVLVTGGAGFLGQHMIGLLHQRAQHVTEIRCLDICPYENKLDYKPTKPMKHFIGSITDRKLVHTACQGVSSVIHIASVVDVSMFPDVNKMKMINIEGYQRVTDITSHMFSRHSDVVDITFYICAAWIMHTTPDELRTSVLLDVCKEVGVQRFLYCSSYGVVMGLADIKNGSESISCLPENLIYGDYGRTKQKAEEIVLEANSEDLRTASIRPVSIYGEEDPYFITCDLKLANALGRWTILDGNHGNFQMVYAGNVAWAFICAEKAMLSDIDNRFGGNAYFASDDTPLANFYEARAPILHACDYSATIRVPSLLWKLFLYVIYFLIFLLSPFMVVKIPFSLNSIRQLFVSYDFEYKKASDMLGYKPLYSYEESLHRSLVFYKKYARGSHG